VSKQDTAEKICQNVFQLHVESALNNQPLVGDKTCKKVLTGHFSVEKIRSIAFEELGVRDFVLLSHLQCFP
jgi:hypothetical protein